MHDSQSPSFFAFAFIQKPHTFLHKSALAAMPSHEGEVDETVASNANVWKPSVHELLIMISLSIITLMISLDATVVVTSLTVTFLCSVIFKERVVLLTEGRLLSLTSEVRRPKDSGSALPSS